jgi:hypothetical protein
MLQLEAALVPVLAYGISMALLLARAPSGAIPMRYTVVLLAVVGWVAYQAQTYGEVGPVSGWRWKGTPGSSWNWFGALPVGLIVSPAMAAGYLGGLNQPKYPITMAALRGLGWLAMVGNVGQAAMGGKMAGWTGWEWTR